MTSSLDFMRNLARKFMNTARNHGTAYAVSRAIQIGYYSDQIHWMFNATAQRAAVQNDDVLLADLARVDLPRVLYASGEPRLMYADEQRNEHRRVWDEQEAERRAAREVLAEAWRKDVAMSRRAKAKRRRAQAKALAEWQKEKDEAERRARLRENVVNLILRSSPAQLRAILNPRRPGNAVFRPDDVIYTPEFEYRLMLIERGEHQPEPISSKGV